MRIAVPTAPLGRDQVLAVKLVAVEDRRHFDLGTARATGPSLPHQDEAAAAHAIGRKHGRVGKAQFDDLLLSEASVRDIVAAAVATGIARIGGVVVDPKDSRYESALPLRVRVEQLWSVRERDVWSQSVAFDARVSITAPLPGFEEGHSVGAHAEQHRSLMTDSRWQQVIEQGIENLSANVARELGPRMQPSPVGSTL